MNDSSAGERETFIITKEYRRFAEFCDACRRYRYIGLCYGPPGIGKTQSARRYAHWDELEPLLPWGIRREAPPIDAQNYRTILYTPTVTTSPRRIDEDIHQLRFDVSEVVEACLAEVRGSRKVYCDTDYIELLIVDEADRLKMASLEQLRDIYDRGNLGLILIGMPGIEKRLSRYAQLYSRVGFVHQFRVLSSDEVRFIVETHWQALGRAFSASDFTDTEALAAIVRITSGNFRLLQRLFAQIERILQINELRTVTKEVVEAARENLVIGIA